MNTIEQNYADYLLSLNDPVLVAMSYDNIMTGTTSVVEETDYYNYHQSLNAADREESEYLIFSYLYDLIDISLHDSYEAAFITLGHSITAKCKRRKEPMK